MGLDDGSRHEASSDGAAPPAPHGSAEGYAPRTLGGARLDFELRPVTGPGARFVALAEEHAADFATRAAGHDRAASFPIENVAALQASGFMAAPLDAELGGLGLTSITDLMIGMSRLARGCASTAIAANMHVTALQALARMFRLSRAAGDASAMMLEALLRRAGAGDIVVCIPNTEPGTDVSAPMALASPVSGGYVLTGRKTFSTLAPVATLFAASVRVPRAEGGYAVGTAVVPRGTPGLRVLDDWDALGMRASGSNSIRFDDCFVPEASVLVQRGAEWGVFGTGAVEFVLAGNMALAALYLGIAEAARDTATSAALASRKGASGRRLADRVPIQELVAEMEFEIATMRAVVEWTGALAERYFAAPSPHSSSEAHAMFKEFQAMKWVMNHASISVVDRAMTVAGGAAFMSGHVLSRLYRDVRAGLFMQPFAPYEALEYVGRVALGLGPALDR